jgi:hypothetical protein
MTNEEYKVIRRGINSPRDADRDVDLFYQCDICNDIIPSVPDDNTNCQCANISIDRDMNRMFVKEFSKFTILRKLIL